MSLDAFYKRGAARGTLAMRIFDELDRAYKKHGAEPWGRHEFYAILKEEVDELWDDIKADAPQENVIKELVQVAAMCFRYFETGDRYRDAPNARVDSASVGTGAPEGETCALAPSQVDTGTNG